MLFHCLEVTTKWSGDASSVLGQKDPAPQSQRVFGSEDDNWLVVEPTHLKNIPQIGFIFSKWEWKKTYLKPLPSLYIKYYEKQHDLLHLWQLCVHLWKSDIHIIYLKLRCLGQICKYKNLKWYCWWFRNPALSWYGKYAAIYWVVAPSKRWLGMGFLNSRLCTRQVDETRHPLIFM